MRAWLAAALAVGGATALGVVWFGNPLAARLPAASASGIAVASVVGDRPPGAVAGAPILQLARLGEPASAVSTNGVAVGQGAAPTGPLTTLTRQWNTASSGVTADQALASQLDQALAGVDGHVSLAVKDLGSGRGAVLDGQRELAAASLYKLPVLYATFAAGLSMAEPLPITEEARAFDAGTLELGVGETLTVAEALERMITISDNTSAVMLGSRVGGARLNTGLAALGLDTTHYSLERMTTSSLDMLRLLETMARGQAVSPEASADMVHLLLRQRVNDRLPRLLPGDVHVAHKTGNLPGTVNDVGLLYGPSSTVAMAALISNTSDEASAANAIARAALVAYTYFADGPPAGARPTLPQAPTRAVPLVWREPRPLPTVRPTVEPTVVAADESLEPLAEAPPATAPQPTAIAQVALTSAATPVAVRTPPAPPTRDAAPSRATSAPTAATRPLTPRPLTATPATSAPAAPPATPGPPAPTAAAGHR